MRSIWSAKCIYSDPDTVGASSLGILVNDIGLLRTNWEVGMKVSTISYCVESKGMLSGFGLSIANKTESPVTEIKLNEFGVMDNCVLQQFKLGPNEYVEYI